MIFGSKGEISKSALVIVFLVSLHATYSAAQPAGMNAIRASQQAYQCISDEFRDWFGLDLLETTTAEGRNAMMANISLYFN
jgi:hypothetical protein